MCKNCAPFIECISKINATETDNVQNIYVVMGTYNLIKYSDNYSEISRSLWQYYKDEPNDDLENSESIKSKVKIFGKLLQCNWLIVNLILFWHGHELALLLILQVKEDLQ